jgi:hypothetical protein
VSAVAAIRYEVITHGSSLTSPNTRPIVGNALARID